MSKKSNRWIVESHISRPDYDIEKDKLIKQIKNIQHPRKGYTEYDEIVLYNSMVLKFQSYYKYATCVNLDVNDLNWQISKIFKNRLQKSRLSKKGRTLTKFEEARFGKSKMLRYISGVDEPIYPIGYISHKNPMNKKAVINPYTNIGREAYMKENSNNDELLFMLMDNRSFGNSDMQRNKILLFEKQCGKCWISGLPFSSITDIHCHHIIARKDNGTDDIDNLVLISSEAHLLVHAKSAKTIEKYMKELNLSSRSINKINKLRESLNLEKIKI